MPKTLELETRRNLLYVHCPDAASVIEIKGLLTFNRLVGERAVKFVNNRWATVSSVRSVPERCYRQTTDPLILECSAGFQSYLIDNALTYRLIGRDTTPKQEQYDKTCNWDRLAKNIQFRGQQREILEKIVTAPRGRIVAATGVGKSFLIAKFCNIRSKARIIVSTYSNTVLEDLYRAISREVMTDVGIQCSALKRKPNARIVCVSQGMISKYINDNRDAFLIDEYHEWGTPPKCKLLESIRHAQLLAFSANKARSDKGEFRLNGIFGPVLAEVTYQDAVDEGSITPIYVVWVPVQSQWNPITSEEYDHDVVKRDRIGIWRNPVRNKQIAAVANLFTTEEQVLIAVSTLDHALHLKTYLPDFEVVYSVDDPAKLRRFGYMGLLDGIPPMDDQRKEYLKRQFELGHKKKMIATNVWSRGVNFPFLSVLIRADVASSSVTLTQWAGRTTRLVNGKEVSLVFDFNDEFDQRYRAKAKRRAAGYKEIGLPQISLAELLKQ
jgi:superfamily II DNA or RNA helicase